MKTKVIVYIKELNLNKNSNGYEFIAYSDTFFRKIYGKTAENAYDNFIKYFGNKYEYEKVIVGV